jgi:hypothetical protein
MISIVVLAAVAGTLLVFENQLNVNADTNSTSTVTSDNSDNSTTTTTQVTNDNSTQSNSAGSNHLRDSLRGCQHGSDNTGYGQIVVSDEFKQNVTDIASNDTDVQNLLNTGYNITSVTPIFQSTVNGNGQVTTQATTAILTLTLDGTNNTGRATILVDLEQAKVTKIYTETRTIIEK